MNKFTNDYNELLKDEFIKVPINNNKNTIYKYIPRIEDILLSWEIAKEKEQHTMTYSQNSRPRSKKEKLGSAFQGTFSELVCHRFLLKELGEPYESIKRYDAERESFVYIEKEEYDIKIQKENRDLDVEIRSSISYKTSIEQAYNQQHIIGTYTNEKKPHENLSDVYIRPYFQYKDIKNRKPSEMNELHKDLFQKRVEIYIMTGAFKEDFLNKSKILSFSQNGTEYHTIEMKEMGDVELFKQRYNKLIKTKT